MDQGLWSKIAIRIWTKVHKCTNRIAHLSIMLFSYIIAYKVATRYTPYQLVYGLHPLMPIKYIVPIASGNKRNNTLM
jgi:hypothetical protein